MIRTWTTWDHSHFWFGSFCSLFSFLCWVCLHVIFRVFFIGTCKCSSLNIHLVYLVSLLSTEENDKCIIFVSYSIYIYLCLFFFLFIVFDDWLFFCQCSNLAVIRCIRIVLSVNNLVRMYMNIFLLTQHNILLVIFLFLSYIPNGLRFEYFVVKGHLLQD